MYEYPPSVYDYEDKVAAMSDEELKDEIVRIAHYKNRKWYHITWLRREAQKRGMVSWFNKHLG